MGEAAVLLGTEHVQAQEKPRTQENKDIFGKPQSITELRGKSKFTTFETVAIETQYNTAGENAGSPEHISSLITNNGGNACLGGQKCQTAVGQGSQDLVLHGASMVLSEPQGAIACF